MALNFRLATHADRAWCMDAADDGFEQDRHSDLKRALPKIWGGWKQSGSMIMAVLEDDELPPPKLIAFACTVFLTNEFVEQMFTQPEPHVALRVVRKELDKQSPVLRLDAIRQANSEDSLNLYIIHYTERFPAHYAEAAKRGARNKMMQGLLETHSGFGLKQIILEFWGEEVLPYALASGLHPRTDYSQYFAAAGIPLPPPQRMPYLVGLSREEATEKKWGATLSLLFDPPPPAFGFSVPQQDVLWIALFEQDNDQWIADRLHIAIHTVRWRWNQIFERVEQVNAGFFGDSSEVPNTHNGSGDQPKRGREKRRLLLQYLRQHVEELHPFTGDAVSKKRWI